MLLNDLNSVIVEALEVETKNVNHQTILPLLRKLRSTIATEGADFQSAAFMCDSLIDNLVKFVDKLSTCVSSNSDSLVSFNVGVQCLANLISNNDSTRIIFSRQHSETAAGWLKVNSVQSKNYVSAILLNVNKVKGLDRELDDVDFVDLLVEVAQSGAEFGVLLLESVIQDRGFVSFYKIAKQDHKSFMLELLKSMISQSDRHLDDILWVVEEFKKHCDHLMSSIADATPSTTMELTLMLDLLAATSHEGTYMETMQRDCSLIISASYFLRGIHACFDKGKSWKESQREAIESLTNANVDQFTTQPFFGVKGNLIRLLGNLAYKNERNQNEIREAGCLPIILDSCKLDGRNPYLKEWSILAIRNLVENNPENKRFIKETTLQGCDGDLILNDSLGLTLMQDDANQVNIAPLIRR